MNYIPIILNALGLLLDIAGAWMLYRTPLKGLEPIGDPFEKMDGRHDGSILSDAEKFADLISRILDESIKKTNAINAIAHKKSFKWFGLILLGSAFQLAGTLYQVFSKV